MLSLGMEALPLSRCPDVPPPAAKAGADSPRHKVNASARDKIRFFMFFLLFCCLFAVPSGLPEKGPAEAGPVPGSAGFCAPWTFLLVIRGGHHPRRILPGGGSSAVLSYNKNHDTGSWFYKTGKNFLIFNLGRNQLIPGPGGGILLPVRRTKLKATVCQCFPPGVRKTGGLPMQSPGRLIYYTRLLS